MSSLKLSTTLLCLALASGGVADGQQSSERFTTVDSIEMTQVIDPAVFGHVETSPDGRWAVVVTQQGDLASGVTTYAANLIDLMELRTKWDAPDSGRPKVVVTMRTHTAGIGIRYLTWAPNSDGFYFLGRSGNDPAQVYQYDIESTSLRKLTDQSTGVMQYASNNRFIVFAVSNSRKTPDRAKYGYVVTAETLSALRRPEESPLTPSVDLYALDLSNNKTVRIEIETTRRPSIVHISPSGSSALLLKPLDSIPRAWTDYKGVSRLLKRSFPAPRSGDAEGEFIHEEDVFGGVFNGITQPVIVNLESGEAKPIPAPTVSFGLIPQVSWAADGRAVVLLPTYAEVAPTSSSDRNPRLDSEVALRISTQDGAPEILSYLNSEYRGSKLGRPEVTWPANAVTEIAWPILSDGASSPQPKKLVRRVDMRSRVTERIVAEKTAAAKKEDIEVIVSQDMNTPPEIEVVDRSRGGLKKKLTSWNERLLKKNLGTAEFISWTDSRGTAYQGGILYPPDYKPGKRYPLVIQNYGFYKEMFLADGMYHTSFAARALAAEDILVLSILCEEGALADWQNRKQDAFATASVSECYDSRIDSLVDQGVVDPTKIGLIGFSGTGKAVMHAITFSQHKYAAASIGDAASATPWSYVLSYGTPRLGMEELDSVTEFAPALVGARFFGDGVQRWMERSPIFHLDRVDTPLRYEHIGRGIPPFWDVFTVMRRENLPIEMIHIPDDAHNLRTPIGLFVSQQGSVDWFVFWLKGTERSQPFVGAPESNESLDQQYARWRKLQAMERAIVERPQSVSPSGH